MKSDNSIHEDERKMLHEILDTNWKKISQKGDPFGAMGMELIESMVMDLDEGEVKPQEAFDYFRSVFFKRKIDCRKICQNIVLTICMQFKKTKNMYFNRRNFLRNSLASATGLAATTMLPND